MRVWTPNGPIRPEDLDTDPYLAMAKYQDYVKSLEDEKSKDHVVGTRRPKSDNDWIGWDSKEEMR